LLKLGVFGGTFNPIHNGHVSLALAAQKTLELDKVLFIPTYTSPFKTDSQTAAALDRLEMVRLATAEYPDFEVSSLEVEGEQISYTVNTLESLKSLYPADAQFFLLMGADSFSTFSQWKDPDGIRKMSQLAVAARVGEKLPDQEGVTLITEEIVPVSASQIRGELGQGRSPEGITTEVYEYIQKRGLYDL
jgi:nicotinate-nucleotide adenylyltransferase